MFNTIVFAYDGSAECRDALKDGIALASRFSARCYLLAIVPPIPPLALAAGTMPVELLEDEQSRFRTILEEGVVTMKNAGVEATGILRPGESPIEAIGAVAHETGANLVIIGHHQRSVMGRWWHGSVGHSLMDNLPCSLFISMKQQDSDE
jgi:nucleotide-binding universal stress UspA family protein